MNSRHQDNEGRLPPKPVSLTSVRVLSYACLLRCLTEFRQVCIELQLCSGSSTGDWISDPKVHWADVDYKAKLFSETLSCQLAMKSQGQYMKATLNLISVGLSNSARLKEVSWKPQESAWETGIGREQGGGWVFTLRSMTLPTHRLMWSSPSLRSITRSNQAGSRTECWFMHSFQRHYPFPTKLDDVENLQVYNDIHCLSDL